MQRLYVKYVSNIQQYVNNLYHKYNNLIAVLYPRLTQPPQIGKIESNSVTVTINTAAFKGEDNPTALVIEYKVINSYIHQ